MQRGEAGVQGGEAGVQRVRPGCRGAGLGPGKTSGQRKGQKQATGRSRRELPAPRTADDFTSPGHSTAPRNPINPSSVVSARSGLCRTEGPHRQASPVTRVPGPPALCVHILARAAL